MRTSDPKFIDFMLGWAIKAGKFPASRRPHYEALFARDPDGTTALLDQLAPGVQGTVVTAEEGLPTSWFRGGAPRTRATLREATAASAQPARAAAMEDALPASWFPEVTGRRASTLAAAPGHGQIAMAHD